MKHQGRFLWVCIFLLVFGVSTAGAALIDFGGTTEFQISLTTDDSNTPRGNFLAAEVGSYLTYSHGDRTTLAVATGSSSASAAAPPLMSASGSWSEGTYTTSGQLHADVVGFVSQYAENRLDVYFYLGGGTYTFNVTVPTWERTLSWTNSSAPLLEAGWYSNLYAKLINQDSVDLDPTLVTEKNLILVNHFMNSFSGGSQSIVSSGANASLTLADLELPEGWYTLYVADYLTQYAVTAAPLPGTLLLLGSGLLAMLGRLRQKADK